MAKKGNDDKRDFRRDRPKVQQRHKRIMDIAAQTRAEMDSRMKHGYSLPDIAKWLQEERGECNDLTHDSLVTTLYRYREDLKPMEVAERLLPSVVRDAKVVIDKQVDELEELQKLYHLQRERIEIGVQFEKASRVLNKNMTQEIAQASSLLMRRHEIKMDLGMDGGRNLGTMTLRPELGATVSGKYDVDIVQAANDPVSRGKALAVARALAALDGDVFDIDFEIEPSTNSEHE
jgi:hypothetical protein